MANENKMGYLPIKKLILQMSLPPMCSMFLQYSYNLVDSMFVANINENALAAVSLSFPITTLMISLSIWIGVGINVLIAGYLGEKEQDLADCATTLGLLVALIVGICINILALLIMKPYFSAFTNNPAIFDYAMQYMSVCAFMQVPNMVHIAIQKVFQGTGNMITPMWFQIAGVIFNFVFDPLLIFGIGPFPELGVSGAAAATVTAQALVSLLFFRAVLREKVLFPHLRLWVLVPVKVWREIVRIGVPSAVQNLIYAGISMILTRLITGWGDLAVAAQRVGSQIESVSWMVGDGFSAAVNAFLGQNYGAKRYDRVRRGYFCAIAMTAAWGLCTTFLLIGMARPLFSIFLQEEEVMALGVNYLRIVGLSQMFMMVEQTSIGAFSGLGRTLYPSIVSVTFTSARIPVAVLLSSVMGLSGIWWALSISSMVKGCILFVSFVLFLYVFLERKKDEKTV